MLEAAFWGFVGGFSLLIGALVGISRPFPARLIGLILGFGAGVLEHLEDAFAAVRRRGAEEAGAILIKLNRLDGTADLFGPAPQSAFDEAQPSDRLFLRTIAGQPEALVEERLAREVRFDPDVWIVEVEDRAGRHFLDLAPS